MELRRAHGDELRALADLAAPLQADGTTHIVYLAIDAADILAELAESTWSEVSSVAMHDGAIVGWLIGDVDVEIGRVWWLGPFAADIDVSGRHDWSSTASALLADARAQLPPTVSQEEMAIDGRFERYRTWAESEGFTAEEGSFVLALDGGVPGGCSADGTVRPLGDEDHDTVIRLHDDMFPGTHTTGRQLVVAATDDRRRRLVFERDGAVLGYVAVELQPDGSGCIDFLGVDPVARRTGVASALVRAGVAELESIGASSIGLTVREGSTGARELYASSGFTEERFALPLRRGFSLGSPA